MTHELKIWPEFFGAVVTGEKNFEYRQTRYRDFRVGDILLLREWCPEKMKYTGCETMRTVSYCLWVHGQCCSTKTVKDFVIMGLS